MYSFSFQKLIAVFLLGTSILAVSTPSAQSKTTNLIDSANIKSTEVPAGTWYVTNKDTQVRVNFALESGIFTNVPKGTYIFVLNANRFERNGHIYAYVSPGFMGNQGWIDMDDLD